MTNNDTKYLLGMILIELVYIKIFLRLFKVTFEEALLKAEDVFQVFRQTAGIIDITISIQQVLCE